MGKWKATSFAILFFAVGFIILLDQYVKIGIWFQIGDIHHETLALFSFALAIGIIIGLLLARNRD